MHYVGGECALGSVSSSQLRHRRARTAAGGVADALTAVCLDASLLANPRAAGAGVPEGQRRAADPRANSGCRYGSSWNEQTPIIHEAP
jgi:hypothetical protein